MNHLNHSRTLVVWLFAGALLVACVGSALAATH
jgi:hypothetical protein